MTYITPDNAQLKQAPEEMQKLIFKHRELVGRATALKSTVLIVLHVGVVLLAIESIIARQPFLLAAALGILMSSFVLFLVERELVNNQKKIRELMQRPEEV